MRACFGFDWAESAVAQRCTRACSSSAASTPITPAAAIASSNGTTPSEHVAVARMLSWRRKTELADAGTNALVTGTMARSKKGFIARLVDRDQARGERAQCEWSCVLGCRNENFACEWGPRAVLKFHLCVRRSGVLGCRNENFRVNGCFNRLGRLLTVQHAGLCVE